MLRFSSRALAPLLCLFLLVSAPAGRADDQYEWEGVERIVAVGDVHGAYENLVRVLQNAGLIDDDLDWIGGKAHLVQNGDVVDRGPESRKAMDFLMKLQDRAKDAGGKVHLLIGNHEAMNIVGLLDLVSKEEYEAFIDRDSRKRHERAFDRFFDELRREARERDQPSPKKSEVWDEFVEQYPLGWIEHRRAFSPDGRYGEWILEHKIAVKINGVLFSHGDWSEKFSEIGIAEVNDRIRKELKGEIPIETGLTFDEASPLQYRGLANTPLSKSAQAAQQPVVDRILANLGATRMVVGHTTTPGMLESRFQGKHISIDVGMLEIYNGGHRVALEIQGDELRSIHDGGAAELPPQLDETMLSDYIRAVAQVDPDNVDIQIRYVDLLREQGRTGDTVAILEHLFELKPDFVPFRYRTVLGESYEAAGETAKAEEQYRGYLQGLQHLVEENPANLNLANLLARFCLDKGIELELAERTIRDAVEQQPDNVSFRITLARVHLARERFDDALRLLGATGEPAQGFAYETFYYSGMAYLGLDETERARVAFERAVEAEPNREEAKEELRRLNGAP